MNNNVQHGGRQGAKSRPGRGESNMASEHEAQASHAKPMRAAAVQSDNASRFRVAGHEPGGISPHHHSKQPEHIPKKPINHTDQQVEHGNQGSKGFVFKDEDFQPLKSSYTPRTTQSPMSSAHLTSVSNVSPKSASAATMPQTMSYSQATSHATSVSSPSTHATKDKHDEPSNEQQQSHTGATRHHHHGSKHKHDGDPMHESLARDDAPTPEMHLETLFREDDPGRMKPRAQKASAWSSSPTGAQARQLPQHVSNTTPRQNEGDVRTSHRDKQSASPETEAGRSKDTGRTHAGADDGFQGYVFHPPTLARDHDSRHGHSANSQAAPAYDSETQKLRHVPAQYPEYHAPVHTPQPQQATFEYASASGQQPPHESSSAPPKKKTWYGVEVPVKPKSSTPKSNAGPKNPLALGFGFKEIRNVAKAGQAHSSGPSTPVPSSEYMQAARVNVPLQNAPLHEDLSRPKQQTSHSVASQPEIQKPDQTTAGARTHQVLGQPYEEPSRVGTTPKQEAAREVSGVHPASYHVPLQNQGHSSTSGIKDSTVDSHSTSNTSHGSTTDQVFEKPSDQRAAGTHGTTVAAAENVLKAGLGGIRSLVGAAMHMPAKVAHALLEEDDEQQETTTTAHSHDHTTLGPRSMQRGHSKAVMLKRPHHVDLSLFPEEDPSYPRGDVEFHENPACPSAASLKSISDKHAGHNPFHALSAGLFKQGGHEKSQAMHSASASSSADTHPEHAYNHTKAVALKKPQQNVTLFAEEDGSYPRDSNNSRHQEHENPDHPPHLVKDVHEVQLDAAHLHPHHDLHPTIGESAAAAIASGVEGMRSMLSGIKLHYISDSLLAPEGRSGQGGQHQRRHSNAAAGAVLSHLGLSSQSTQQWNAQSKDDLYSHRGDAYYGQHGNRLAGHTHPTSTESSSSPFSTAQVPLQTGHRGDAYYGQHEDTESSVRATSKESPMNTFPLESGHRGDAYFGQGDAQGHQSSSSHSTGPIYSPVSSPAPTNQQRNFPVEPRHRGDAYYGQYDAQEAHQHGGPPAQANLFPAAVQQVEQQQLQQQQQQQQQHQRQGLAHGQAPPLQSRVAQPARPTEPPAHASNQAPTHQALPEHANAYPAAVQDLDRTELNRPQKPVPTVPPTVLRQQQASIQQSRAQQQPEQQQAVPPKHANVYASAVRRAEQQQQQQQQQQQELQEQPEALNEGEKVDWVKKVKVTEEFYDADDDLDLDHPIDRNAAHPAHGNAPHQYQGQTAGRRQPSGPAQ